MNNYVKRISLCLGLAASLTFAQTTTAPIYNMSILAGIPTGANFGDGGNSTAAIVDSPEGVAIDGSGNVYVADRLNSRIRKLTLNPNGGYTASTFATTQASCYVGVVLSGNTTTNGTCLNHPQGMTFDPQGNLLVTQSDPNGGYILRITPDGKSIQALVGTNVSGTYGGDGQYANNSVINNVGGIATDSNGDIFFTDNGNNRVKWIPNINGCIYNNSTVLTGGNPLVGTSCKIYTIAGNTNQSNLPQFGTTGGNCPSGGTCTPSGTDTVGDGGLAINARVSGPWGIAVSPDGSAVYVAQNGDHRVRKINMQTGLISTVAGTCLSSTTASTNGASGTGPGGTGGTAPIGTITGATHPLPIPCPSGSYGSATSSSSGAQNTLYDGSVGTQATLNSPRGLYLDSNNNILYIADGSNNRIRQVNLGTGVITTVVGGGSTTGDSGTNLSGGLLTSLSLSTPYDVKLANGLIYWVEQGNNRVRVADPVAQVVHTLTATPKSTGSGGPATSAYLGFSFSLASSASPRVAVDPSGNVYAIEASVSKIRQVTPDGTIHDWAGTGVAGFISDVAGPAIAQRMSSPQQVVFDSAGNAYIADTGNNRIRKVDTSGNMTTVVGRTKITSCTTQTFANGTCTVDKSSWVGDGGAPTSALLNAPQGVAIDTSASCPNGDTCLVIADTGNQCIRYADLTANLIYTIGGGLPAKDPSGNVLPNGPTDGRSGIGTNGSFDSTNALDALIDTPRGVAVDNSGNIYIMAYNNSEIKEMIPVNPAAHTYGLFSWYGSGSSSGTTPNIPTGTGLPSVPARIRVTSANATSVAVDTGGNIYMALPNDNRIHVASADHSRVYVVCGNGNNDGVGASDTGLNYTSGNALNTNCPAVTGVAVDSSGNVYAADRTGVIRKLACTKNCLPLH